MNRIELKAKYPRFKVIYDPIPGCRHCHGTGELRSVSGHTRPCTCVCIAHDLAELVQDTLNKMAREFREGEQ